MNMKVLVAYYSLTGHTQRVADEIAARCDADVERIQDADVQRAGWGGYFRSGWQAFAGIDSPIRPPLRRVADYDLVVIGTPVWNWSLSSPMRSYAKAHARDIKRVAFFCTEGGSGDRRVFAELERLCGQQPVATVALRQQDVEQGRHITAVTTFVARLGLP